jgi:hypothetical protein
VPNATNGAYPPAYPAYPGYPGQPQAPQSHFFRDLFAQTIAAVIQTSGGGLFGMITGRIMDWFARKTTTQAPNPYLANQNPQYPAPSYGAPNSYPQTYPNAFGTTPGQPAAYPTAGQSYPAPAAPGAYGAPAYPGVYPTPNAPANPYPTDPNANPYAASAYAASASYAGATAQVYDARTGQLATGAANPYATRAVGMENALYAGIAYEVHAIGAGGQTTPINTATYTFHTGDKFMVYYRPSLPGHMEIYNVNAAGQKTLIDSSNMAAGQMVGLGPYQFANQAGDETLQLVLSPCSNPQLLAATRDIVKVDAGSNSASTGGLKLGNCGAPTARGVNVTTRDIQKVALEGTTSFALDPLSGQEVSSGQVIPRQAIIVFHHL